MKNTWGGIDLANECALSLRLRFIEAAEISLVLVCTFFQEICHQHCLSVEFTYVFTKLLYRLALMIS